MGICGLHTVHNSFKTAFTASGVGWNVKKFLCAIFHLFNNVPARRGDYLHAKKNLKNVEFPIKFCGVRWVENYKVAQKALKILPLQNYIDLLKRRKKSQFVTATM